MAEWDNQTGPAADWDDSHWLLVRAKALPRTTKLVAKTAAAIVVVGMLTVVWTILIETGVMDVYATFPGLMVGAALILGGLLVAVLAVGPRLFRKQ